MSEIIFLKIFWQFLPESATYFWSIFSDVILSFFTWEVTILWWSYLVLVFVLWDHVLGLDRGPIMREFFCWFLLWYLLLNPWPWYKKLFPIENCFEIIGCWNETVGFLDKILPTLLVSETSFDDFVKSSPKWSLG